MARIAMKLANPLDLGPAPILLLAA